ncbi:hypothetical protein DMN91_010275 [Ooceraea biroi]|uniref:Chitin-binding type-2 domain-containing protein n=1 Tax=Ooceraea biroi TaxID=2015173 RepID=A0A026WK93_OOCBI|nr:uncharacterized protein LOC105278349 [Ooceraea biroi]EZA56393.1 hypothetical protein X777_03013 [Ooceraea biroi]RLU18033.1 hypothetical protein DMN91_010275 [Ooceraea biroi]
MERVQILVPVLCLLCAFVVFRDAKAQTALPVCTIPGVFEIVDGTCKNYYICVDDGVNLIPVVLSCASTAIFDPVRGICVPESTAICQQTTTPSPLPTTTPGPLCVRYGRFPIPNTNCKSYYLCYWNGMGYSVMNNLTCPNTLLFEPVSEKCVSPLRYSCPVIQG